MLVILSVLKFVWMLFTSHSIFVLKYLCMNAIYYLCVLKYVCMNSSNSVFVFICKFMSFWLCIAFLK
jgi:hypothetical protein